MADELSAKDSAILAGRPDESELVARISSDDPDLRMPPVDAGKSLSPEEIELLTRSSPVDPILTSCYGGRDD